MAIYNKRANFDLKQWSAHFQRRNSVLEILYSIIRFLVIIIQNLYCIPSYLVLSWLALLPTSWLRSDLYSKLENYLYNSLLFIVSSWSLAAGLTVVESGDEFKHLIEEPEKSYEKEPPRVACNKNNNNIGSPKRFLDTSNCRVVVNGYANKSRPLQASEQVTSISTRARSNGRLKCNGVASNGLSSNGLTSNGYNQYDGDHHTTNRLSHENSLLSTALKEDNFANNNNEIATKDEKNTMTKFTGCQVGNCVGINKIVTKGTPLTQMRLTDEHHSLKTAQAKPRILLLCNHISTADVPLMMQTLSTLTNQSILWVLDAQFKMTNFGVVCGSHGDFFVDKNSYVDGALREHVLKYPDRNLLVLFPEGGFLRKRLEGSNRYATRNGLQHTQYVTHPRFGAFKDLTDPSVGITHIVDATLIYDDIKNPISILDIAFGNKKEPAILHFKVYNRSEITPDEEWLRSIWLEKDKLLARYYADKSNVLKEFAKTFRVAALDWFKVLSVHLFYLLVCYLTLFRLLNATSTTMLKARELYYRTI